MKTQRHLLLAAWIGAMLVTGCLSCGAHRMELRLSEAKYTYYPVVSERATNIQVSTAVVQNRHTHVESPSFFSEDCVLVCKVIGDTPLCGIQYKTISLRYFWMYTFLYDLPVDINVVFNFASNGAFLGIQIPDAPAGAGIRGQIQPADLPWLPPCQYEKRSPEL